MRDRSRDAFFNRDWHLYDFSWVLFVRVLDVGRSARPVTSLQRDLVVCP